MSSERAWSSAVAVALAWLALAAPAAAQADADADPVTDASAVSNGLLSRADFRFGWANLVATDRRFDWQGQIGFDVDLLRVGRSRVRFRGEYEGILGRERRRYDLNQGNYRFEVSGATAIGHAEVAVISQHVSRHLVDRDQVPSISWNTIGVRVASTWTGADGFGPTSIEVHDEAMGATRLDGEIEIARAMQQAFVDYAWISRARVAVRHGVTPSVALVAAASGEVIGVTQIVAQRDRVCGGRIEGGIRVRGGAAAVEVFAGYERRIDAFPADRFRVRFFTAGVRVLTLSAS